MEVMQSHVPSDCTYEKGHELRLKEDIPASPSEGIVVYIMEAIADPRHGDDGGMRRMRAGEA